MLVVHIETFDLLSCDWYFANHYTGFIKCLHVCSSGRSCLIIDVTWRRLGTNSFVGIVWVIDSLLHVDITGIII